MQRTDRKRSLLQACLLNSQVAFALALTLTAIDHQKCVAQEVDFANDIQTVLTRRCYACHGPDQQEGGVRFDQRETLLVAAETGEIPIVPGHADKSEILRRITSEDEFERMPPEGKPLTPEEVELISRWIDGGA
ncbi:MAG: c-type cytochrome domain-containing protein, partial [Planctomycetota bacterium]